MATADEILTEYGAVDDVLVVNLDTRTIVIPKSVTNLGVESDDDVKRLWFKMLKQYGEFDLSEFEVRINYTNANKDDDFYPVEDVITTDDGYMIFSWLIGRFACVAKGVVEFNVCLKRVDETGIIIKEFNATTANLPVLVGKETSEAVYQQYPDVIENMLVNMNVGKKATTTSLDFTNWYSGSFKETLSDGTILTHAVEFDQSGNVISIGGIAISGVS